MNLDDVDRRLREVVARIPAGDRAYLLEVLTSDDAARARAFGNLYAPDLVPAVVELLFDAEEEPPLRALLVGLLRETGGWPLG